LQRDHLADERSDAHGEIVWSWHPGADAKPALRRARGRRGQKSRSPGRVRISRKAVAQGGRAFSAEPVVLPRAFCCTRTAGASRRPASLRPLLSQRVMSSQSSDANAPRERTHLAPSSRGATRRGSPQSRRGAGEVLDSSASLAMTRSFSARPGTAATAEQAALRRRRAMPIWSRHIRKLPFISMLRCS
jgi:hypothetical protein